jgi:hypothetical protein
MENHRVIPEEPNSATGEKRTFQRPLFPPELKSKLVAFTEAANALNKTAFAANRDQISVSLHFSKDGRISNTGSLPPDDEIAAFLHLLRPIYLEKEALNYNTISNLVSAHLNDDTVTQCLREWKRNYDARASREVFEIAAAGKVLNSQEFLNYLNALEYHRDQDRRKVIDEISGHYPLEAQKAIIVLLLAMRLQAIKKLTSFLLNCFSREDGQPITLEMA